MLSPGFQILYKQCCQGLIGKNYIDIVHVCVFDCDKRELITWIIECKVIIPKATKYLDTMMQGDYS